jgi:hypothetical protein
LKINHFVRQSLFFSFLLGSLSLSISHARADVLPDIEAHQFKVTPLEKSRTGRVYRFKVDPEQLPKTGNIVLIEVNDKPAMAFRVLKTDALTNEFIGKRVRRYDTTGELSLNEQYPSAEKVADLVTPPPPEVGGYDPNARPLMDPNPNKNLVSATNTAPTARPELNPSPDIATPVAQTTPAPQAAPVENAAPIVKKLNVEQYDDDLDSSTSPMNLKEDSPANTNATATNTDMPDTPEMDPDADIQVKERTVINPYRYLAGISVASFMNHTNFIFANPSSSGFTGYFSNVVKRGLIYKKESPQDSLSMEYGFCAYTVETPNTTGGLGSYSLFPIRAEVRYDLYLSEMFTLFGYGGGQFNWIYSRSQGTVTDAENLEGLQLNLGVGVFYNMGPQWYLRGDVGIDRIALGLALRW